MSVFTLASMFIVSCPAGNTPLPFTAFPSLTLDGNTCTCEEPDCSSPSVYINRDEHGWPHHHQGGSSPAPCSPPTAGQPITLTAAKTIPAGSYVTFVNGLTVTSVRGSIKGKRSVAWVHRRESALTRISGKNITVKIPTGIMGQAYVFVTKSDVETTFSDTQVLFGPAVVEVTPPAPVLNYNILKA